MSKIISSIKDNRKRGNVGDFLNDSITSNAELSIVSAYFTIYAYNKLKSKLGNIDHLKFLFGEPTFIKALDPEKTNRKDFKIEDESLVISTDERLSQKSIAQECYNWIKEKVEIKSLVKPNFLHGKLYHIQQQSGVEKAILGSSNFTVNGLGLGSSPNIELNMIVDSDRDRLDLKKWFLELWYADLNPIEKNNLNIDLSINIQEENIVEDVKEDVLKYLEQLYIENEPEFIYFKTLYHIFEQYLDEQKKGGLLNERTGFYDSEIWSEILYEFQKDGVKGAINKILKHNGCIIADSVGLGKTFEALAVIKYFEILNYRVLVICPKKLAGNWTIYQSSQNNSLNPFKRDKFNYSVLYHTDLGRLNGKSDANGIDLENFNWGAYDLVVIDESHNFRGNPLDKVREDGTVRMNRPKWLMEKIIKKGVKTKVLLLSATPVNNNLRDLRNQIALITEGNNDAMFESTQIKDIALSLKNAQTQFTLWADVHRNPSRTVKQLIERLDTSFFKLLDELTIARSRKHIKNFYKAEAEIGKFPERLKPDAIYPSIDTTDQFFSYDTLNKKILDYKLSVFNPSKYVQEGLKSKYGIKTQAEKTQAKKEREERKKKRKKGVVEEQKNSELNFDQSDREHFLIGMMKVNFLKRLESSIESFEISMNRTIEKILKLENDIKEFKKQESSKEALYEADNYEPDEDELGENDDDLDAWEVGKKLKFKLKDLNLDDWLKDLKQDREALYDLYLRAKDVNASRDAKLLELKGIIQSKIKKPLNPNNKKVIVFTAFADTANYLYREMLTWATETLKVNIALVAGSDCKTTFGKAEYSNVLTNFSPISKNRNKMNAMPQEGEIDILIATDCISEGQNLQDCDYLINYDIHWNPVRIIQRFGRIDRLGSKNTAIKLVNFWPTKDLDSYINLKERVEARMALVDVTATADDNVLATDQIEELIEDDLKYRNQQLKKLQKEVLDLEDMDENISLTDFTLDDFRIELLNFLEKNKQKLENAPLGLYAVVPAPAGSYDEQLKENNFSEAEKDIIKPGVIYCLKQKGNTEGNETVNPLQPYFLVYIREDGTVRFNFTNAKSILEVYRLMCTGITAPYNKLCELFNNETNNGAEMSKYTELLKQAVDEISKVFKKRNNQKLTMDRHALLIPQSKQVNEVNNFDLITWLVIK
jgi:superfamily II DNA or RNA helicase